MLEKYLQKWYTRRLEISDISINFITILIEIFKSPIRRFFGILIFSMKLNHRQIKTFQSKVYAQARQHHRDFPWRRTKNPWRILVSEIMLQQTQADRVVAKYKQFIKIFPSASALAKAPLRKVLQSWQGLGYNRRAKMLWQAAQMIVEKHRGRVPKTTEALESLPGIGPYTARAIRTFAFNQPEVFIETNIRSVFIHEFFSDHKKVTDAELLPLIEQTLDRKNPRRWYTSLMDCGTVLKRQHKNPSRRSAHYARQSKFIGSNRQIRGAVIRELTESTQLTTSQLLARLSLEPARLQPVLVALTKEGLVRRRRQKYSL